MLKEDGVSMGPSLEATALAFSTQWALLKGGNQRLSNPPGIIGHRIGRLLPAATCQVKIALPPAGPLCRPSCNIDNLTLVLGDRQQNVEDFMDEEEVAALRKSAIKTTANYDTFGDTATEMAQKAAAADAQARPSVIPGAMFKDLITPVPDSIGELLIHSSSNHMRKLIWPLSLAVRRLCKYKVNCCLLPTGLASPDTHSHSTRWFEQSTHHVRLSPTLYASGVKLLQKMGWRQGKGIGSADAAAGGQGSKGSRWGRVAGVGVENTPLHLLAAKENQYGLGFDPFKVCS